MTNPAPPDGPIPDGLTAGIDETVIYHGGGVTYVIAGVVFHNARPARRAFHQLTADRKRPFRWRKEGPTIRDAAVTLLETCIAATHLLARGRVRRLGHRPRSRHRVSGRVSPMPLLDGVECATRQVGGCV